MTVGVFLSVNEHCNCDRFTKGFNESTNLNLIPANRNNKAHMVINTLDVKQNKTKAKQKSEKKKDSEKQWQEKEEVIKNIHNDKKIIYFTLLFSKIFSNVRVRVLRARIIFMSCANTFLCVYTCVFGSTFFVAYDSSLCFIKFSLSIYRSFPRNVNKSNFLRLNFSLPK